MMCLKTLLSHGNKHLFEFTASLPVEWLSYISTLAEMLELDYYLVVAFILHESGGDPTQINKDVFPNTPSQQATGLMQIIPQWHRAYLPGGQYYNNHLEVINYAEEKGADITNLLDPLGNIVVGMMMLNEQRKLCNNPNDMHESVGRQGEGKSSMSTYEILYYRDYLARQAGQNVWYTDSFYSPHMKR